MYTHTSTLERFIVLSRELQVEPISPTVPSQPMWSSSTLISTTLMMMFKLKLFQDMAISTQTLTSKNAKTRFRNSYKMWNKFFFRDLPLFLLTCSNNKVALLTNFCYWNLKRIVTFLSMNTLCKAAMCDKKDQNKVPHLNFDTNSDF